MRNLVRLAVAVVALASVSGCGLVLLPCYVCAACAGAGGGGVDVAVDPNTAAPLPEVKLQLERHTALTPAALKH
jgi:hypothetical protein